MISIIKKSLMLSPVYAFGAISCSTALVINADDSKITKLFLSICILANCFMIQVNYRGYKRILEMLKKYGYKNISTNLFLDTYCGRQQLKHAAKETGFFHHYIRQRAQDPIRWYQVIDRKSKLNSIMYSLVTLSQLKILVLSIVIKILKTNQESKNEF